MKKLSIIFSFRNEESNIPELVKRVSNTIDLIKDIEYQMIFINDYSTDNSLELLLNLKTIYPIKIVNMSRNFGNTPCIFAGLTFADGDAAIYMDSDLQDPPELIIDMWNKFLQGADVVHMTRTHRDGENWLKLFLTRYAYKIINYLSDIPLPENTGDFKLLSKKVINKILEFKEVDPYMRGISIWVGFNQEFIYYRRDARWSGETKFPLLSKAPAREFIRGLTAYSATPLYISLYLGLLTILAAVLLIIYAIITKFLGLAYPGSSSTLIAISVFSGVILITNGVIGIYISKIYYEVKNRPKYIIKEIIE